MNKENIIKNLHKVSPLLREKYQVKNLGVFGSYSRNEEKKNSDVDILVEFERPIGLLKFIELENYLSTIVGIKVDLVLKKALKPRIGKFILKDVIPI